ncbi:hypothetical protein A8L34_28125 [Bacillus sp. FJAT-27264]|uniref:hypothetical protein n=1 Tax=Paenibacillus sp. (strain DSM 101736 / FJAT-27264) TaxID=1850362 RepID=UPI000807C6C8|nr:hypothetical protein [Bacillus sp. FJAT-27264]OBZ15916.1 hypothetical protein A8L34_28125 [Bacillus sp. FJAT-27264]
MNKPFTLESRIEVHPEFEKSFVVFAELKVSEQVFKKRLFDLSQQFFVCKRKPVGYFWSREKFLIMRSDQRPGVMNSPYGFTIMQLLKGEVSRKFINEEMAKVFIREITTFLEKEIEEEYQVYRQLVELAKADRYQYQ